MIRFFKKRAAPSLAAAKEDQTILLSVPFTSQAPLGNWKEDIFQYGCEEAALLMAMRWVEGKPLSKEEAEKEIETMAAFEQEHYGNFYDTSAADTAQLMKDYFGYHRVEVKSDIGAADIKRELREGNVVLVPIDGAIVDNPYYASPLSIHMIVVVGYDPKAKEFIVHDPGTRRGKYFRHPEDILDKGLRDYVTGRNEPVTQIRKVMIVVQPR